MQEIILKGKCPNCGNPVALATNANLAEEAPKVRSNITPVSSVQIYKITSEQMKQFIIQKARTICPDVRIDVIPKYTEKKNRRKGEPHRAYASLRIAFSEAAIDKKEENGWYGKIGESGDSVKMQPSIFRNFIQMYQYNSKDLDNWMSSYKNLEELEETLGITESYLKCLKEYARPARINTKNGETWIIFSAAAENVIKDMLTDVKTQELPGRMQIQDIHQISSDIVEFIVYVYPNDVKMTENPAVRQILLGNEKAKK